MEAIKGKAKMSELMSRVEEVLIDLGTSAPATVATALKSRYPEYVGHENLSDTVRRGTEKYGAPNIIVGIKSGTVNRKELSLNKPVKNTEDLAKEILAEISALISKYNSVVE